MMHGQENIR